MTRNCIRKLGLALLLFCLAMPAVAEEAGEQDAPPAETEISGTAEQARAVAAEEEEQRDESGESDPIVRSKNALDFQYANFGLPNFRFIGSQDAGLGGRIGYGARVAYEWMFLRTAFGAVGVGLGFGLGVKDNVQFVATDGATRKASLTIVPVDLFFTYHLALIPYQFVVPFVKVGGGLTAGWQTSVTGAAVARALLYTRFDWGAGLQLSLSAIDRSAQKDIETKFGIEAVYIVLEYLKSSKLSGNPEVDFSGDRYIAGFRFEF